MIGIRIEREPTERGPSLDDTVTKLEESAALEATRQVSEIWPTKTGETLPVARGNAMEFTSHAAPFIRRSGDPVPLLDVVVPEIAAKAADDTFNHFAEALARAALKGV